MQAAFIMRSPSTIKKFGTDYLSLKPHTMGGWCGHMNICRSAQIFKLLSGSCALPFPSLKSAPRFQAGSNLPPPERPSGATRELSCLPCMVGGWVQVLSVSQGQSKVEEDVESGEDTGVSRRNSRLLVSSFSKRKVSRGPGLGGPMWFYRHPCTIC